MASLGAATSGGIARARPVEPDNQSFRMMLRSWRAELAPFPNRWRRAARVGFVTALGAGVTAILQISNPLGLTMLLSFAAPEYAFSLPTAIAFLVGAAAMQILMLAMVGAMVNAPVLHVCVFIAYVFVTTYLIYGVPGLGRFWVWVQLPTPPPFYLFLSPHRRLGWDNAQMFAGLAVAVTMLWVFNNVIWPEPAAAVVPGALRGTIAGVRSHRCPVFRTFLPGGGVVPEHSRVGASQLPYPLTL